MSMCSWISGAGPVHNLVSVGEEKKGETEDERKSLRVEIGVKGEGRGI